jgi:hypothetical protein
MNAQNVQGTIPALPAGHPAMEMPAGHPAAAPAVEPQAAPTVNPHDAK